MGNAGLIRNYLAYMEQCGLKASTRYCRGRTLERLARWLPVPLAETTPEMMRAWRADLRLCNQSVRNYVTDARQFFAWAVAAGLREDNPATGVPVPRRPRTRMPRPIATADLVLAITTAPERIRPWIVLAAFCGLRCCEIAWLRRECVLEGPPHPVILVAADATKGDRERIVPMITLVIRELERAGLAASGWMFRRCDGQAGPNTPHTVSTLINRHLRECGIRATAHQLRHWFGSEAYAIDNDLLGVAELMGHASTDSTKGYALISAARKARIVDAIPVPAELAAA